jgi:hypothetical protein
MLMYFRIKNCCWLSISQCLGVFWQKLSALLAVQERLA